MPMSARPVPVPDVASAPFWEACARHEFTLPRCSQCGEFSMPPADICPNCHSAEPRFAFEPVSGRGKVRAWTIIRQSFLQGFDVPYLLVDVQFDDQPGVRIIGRLLDGPDTKVRGGEDVCVGFEDLEPGVAIPAFRLRGPAA